MDTTPQIEDSPKGINWLSIFGIVALVILVFIVIYAITIWNRAKENPIVQSAMRLEPAIAEMMDMTRSQIENEAAYVPSEQLGKDPTGFDDRYVMTDGAVSKEESIGVEQNMALNIYRDDESYKGYVIDDSVVVVDISGEGPDVAEGTTIMAYGRLFVLRISDIWELPIVGENLRTEFGDVEGMSETVVFLIAKDVEITGLPSDDGAEPLPGELVMEDGADEMTEEPATDETMPAEEPVEDEAAADETEEPEEGSA